jgi:membrane protein
MSGQVVDWFGTMGAGSNLKLCLSHLLSMAAAFVLLFLLYALMPNTHVSVRAAAVGAIVGSVLWEGAKFAFKVYVVTAVPYSALYGSLGLIPLFLFWIYVTWLIVLFGLILTYTLQTLRGRRFIKSERVDKGLLGGDPDWMLPIMSEIAQAFEDGRSIDNQEVADRLGLSSRIVHEMTGKLVEAQLLRKVSAGAGEEDSLSLARPADRIPVADILTLAHLARPSSDNPAWKTLDHLHAAEHAAADGKTLADIALQRTGAPN